MKKRFIVAALVSALAAGGIGVAVVERRDGTVEHTTDVTFDSRDPDRLPAPPRPDRQKPIERVISAPPK